MADKVEKRILTLYSDVQATSVHWLWYPFIRSVYKELHTNHGTGLLTTNKG